MDKNKLALILYAVCAGIWTVRAVLEIAYQTYKESVLWFVLALLCAIVWIAAAIAQYRKYRSNKDK